MRPVVAGEDLRFTCNYNSVLPYGTETAFHIGSSVYIVAKVGAV